jgi:hypothetical protein
LDYLEEKELKYNIMFVGNIDVIVNEQNYSNKFNHIKFNHKSFVSKNELIEIYNLSKNNLIMSGRDAFPRVVAESASCGCFNIGLDTLKDGITAYDGEIGILLGDALVQKEMIKDSMSYVPSEIIFNKIVEEIEKKRDYNQISLKYKKNYNIDELINDINLIIQNTI